MEFARILKDKTGRVSGYRECDGEIAYMPEQQSYENITETRHAIRLRACKNPAAFVILSDGYTKDDERVYFYQATVKKAISHSFTVLSDGYACDDKHIFWRDRLLSADRASFKVLEDGYAEDDYHRFVRGTMVKKEWPMI